MKKNRFILMIALLTTFFYGCFQEEWNNDEQFVKEVYIISPESTSASIRDISETFTFTFVDTIRYLDLEYNSDTIKNFEPEPVELLLKVGIGGSLLNDENCIVTLKFDTELLGLYNSDKGSTKIIPDFDLLECNQEFNKADSTITLEIEAGACSEDLRFNWIVERDRADTYYQFSFPLRIIKSTTYPIHRLNDNFITTGFVVDSTTIVNWSGIPIPDLPLGKYVSTQLQGNPGENRTSEGKYIIYKYITKLARNEEPELENHYMIWGCSAWSWGMHAFNDYGWMYTPLYLNDEDFGTYTIDPILRGNTDFPANTFDIHSVQRVTEKSKFDPRSKQLIVYYENVIHTNYTDVLTYVGPDWSIDRGIYPASCGNWDEVRARGYNYWLPIDEEGFDEE